MTMQAKCAAPPCGQRESVVRENQALKASRSPGLGQRQAISRPVVDNVMKAVVRSGPPKQMLVTRPSWSESGRPRCSTEDPSGEMTVIPPSKRVPTHTLPSESTANESIRHNRAVSRGSIPRWVFDRRTRYLS